MTTQLHYIRAESIDGDNFDLFLFACDDTEAMTLWRTYFQIDEWEGDRPVVYRLPAADQACAAVVSWQTLPSTQMTV